MSAWRVSKMDIDALVTAALTAEELEAHATRPTRADEFGKLLWTENYASVNRLYNERCIPPAYRFELLHLAPVALLKHAAYYRYQSCEHPGWKTSIARAFTGRLFDTVLEQISPAHAKRYRQASGFAAADILSELSGFDAAPWGLDL